MRTPSSPVLGISSIAVTLATTAAAALGWLPRAAWVVLLILGVGGIVAALILHFRRGQRAPDTGGRESLKAQLRAVDGVRTWLGLLDDPSEPLALEDDRVFQWAEKTFEVVQEAAPAEADAFMGESHAPLGSPYFATAYVVRTEQTGRREFLETRANIVRDILRAS